MQLIRRGSKENEINGSSKWKCKWSTSGTLGIFTSNLPKIDSFGQVLKSCKILPNVSEVDSSAKWSFELSWTLSNFYLNYGPVHNANTRVNFLTFFSFINWAAFSYSGFIRLQCPHPEKENRDKWWHFRDVYLEFKYLVYTKVGLICLSFFAYTYTVHRTWPAQIFHQSMPDRNSLMLNEQFPKLFPMPNQPLSV